MYAYVPDTELSLDVIEQAFNDVVSNGEESSWFYSVKKVSALLPFPMVLTQHILNPMNLHHS